MNREDVADGWRICFRWACQLPGVERAMQTDEMGRGVGCKHVSLGASASVLSN
jgi:hypothetical protein